MRACYICDRRKARDSEEKIPVCNLCAAQWDIEFIIFLDAGPEPEPTREEIITEDMELPAFELELG